MCTLGGIIDLLDFYYGFSRFSKVNRLFIRRQLNSLDCLCAHDPYDICPIVIDVIVFEHVPDSVHQLIGKNGQINMRFYPYVILMVDRPDV